MSIWDWTLRAYGQNGVPEACLTLQDDYAQNTSFLLWAVWAEAEDPAMLARAAVWAKDWDEKVLTPIRDSRRALKPAFPPVGDGAREGLRDDIKAAELRAERVLMETLAEMAGAASGDAHALDALRAAAAAWGRPVPDAALARLAQALH
jgi:uncharacterized protein (TIGR02444 family)